jgi:hypothetical protein
MRNNLLESQFLSVEEMNYLESPGFLLVIDFSSGKMSVIVKAENIQQFLAVCM